MRAEIEDQALGGSRGLIRAARQALAGFPREEVRKVVFDNPYDFFDQSPNFDYER